MRKRIKIVLAATAVSAVAAVGTVAAANQDDRGGATAAQRGVSGDFSLIMMVHTTSSSFGDLPGVRPWDGRRNARGAFQYRSIPCSGNAPVNNIASDLPSYNGKVAESRAPSSMRAHPFGFRVRKRDGRYELTGRIIFTVCKLGPGPTAQDDPVPDSRKPKIYVRFRARFDRVTGEQLRWAGRFRITGGTQRYDDLRGTGDIAGYLFCFAPAGCGATGGNYLDGQFVMHGRYSDSTPDLSGD